VDDQPDQGDNAVPPPDHSSAPRGRHERQSNGEPVEIGSVHQRGLAGLQRRARSQPVFAALAVLLCLLLGVAIVTQVRQNESGESLDTARPGDLLVLLDSLRQREATLNTEVSDLQNTLATLQESGSNDQAAIENTQARLAALAILIGTVGATGPGVAITIDDPRYGVAPEVMLDVINELRAAGAEAMEVWDAGHAVRVGVSTWVVGTAGALEIDGTTLRPPYSVSAIGDPATLAAAMNIPGGAVDSVKRVGGSMSVQQADQVEVTALRQPKPRQYAQPVK
jgi:uncharacterized protein YlxW (UPF0749 family)